MATVKLQNSSNDPNTNTPVDVRVVMVHLETENTHAENVAANETKSIGNLADGHWVVVMTHQVNGEPRLLGAGIAAVIFPNTLVALFGTGVDSANADVA